MKEVNKKIKNKKELRNKINKKNIDNKGVTIISLVITIIVLLIISMITINTGADIVYESNLETLKTNMLLIEAQVTGYQEEVSFKSGTTNDETMASDARVEIYEGTAKLQKLSEADSDVISDSSKLSLSDTTNNYYVTDEALEDMGLTQINDSRLLYNSI